MEFWLLVLLWLAPSLADRLHDPAPGVWQSKEEVRNLECARMPQTAAHERYPGVVPEPSPRTGTMVQIDALICSRRVIGLGTRAARDEVILSSLSRTVGELTQSAQAWAGSDGTWQVEAFYPDPRVASKIAGAARTDLAGRGLRVSERVPLLAAGDLAVMRGLPAKELYPWACRRWFDLASLGPADTLLGVALLDERETQLHAGVCSQGNWRWLQ